MPAADIALREALVASDDGGRMRNLSFKRHRRKVTIWLDRYVPRGWRLSIVGTIDHSTTVWLSFILKIKCQYSQHINDPKILIPQHKQQIVPE